jgi:ATP-dependent DNA helicase RecQ
MDLPKNVESYYQETGRAGRDGLRSDALLFFSWGDVIKLKKFAEVEGNADQSEIMLNKLNLMGKFGELKTCRRKFLLEYFSEEFTEDCGTCDNCTTVVERFDGTVIAQKALSAVYRTGQRFGLGYLIDFLRGSQSEKIRDEHKNIKTYGIGADISKDDWFDYFKDLIAQGYLAQSDGQYPVLVLTEKSDAVLRQNEAVRLVKLKVKEAKKPKLVSEVSHPYDQGLFEQLRFLRTRFANQENLPAYIIFSDATLVEMATYLPQTSDELRRISGVGDLKFDKYGAAFLNEIVAYCAQHKLASRIDLKSNGRAPRKRTKRETRVGDTYNQSLELFRQGKSIPEIAHERDITQNTVQTHLARFVTTGEITLDELVPPHKVEPIRAAVTKFNSTGLLSPIKDYLGDDYTYAEIKAVIASM